MTQGKPSNLKTLTAHPATQANSNRTISRSATTLVCLSYTAGLTAFLVLRACAVMLPPFLALLNLFTPFLFLPSVPALLLGMRLRSRAILISSLLLLILFTAQYGILFLPKHTLAAAHSSNVLTVMTFNVGPGASQPEQVVAAIENEAADIVALQELTPPYADALRAEFSKYPHRIMIPEEQTTALLSRYPISTSQWLHTEGRRSTLSATVNWAGTPVHLSIVHPLPPGLSWYKDTPLPTGLHDDAVQYQLINETLRMEKIRGTRIMLGDFNMSDQTHAYRRIARSFQDAYREAGWGFGFTFPYGISIAGQPIPGPFIRLDYIFHSEDLDAENARINCRNGSDHCYLVTTLSKREQ